MKTVRKLGLCIIFVVVFSCLISFNSEKYINTLKWHSYDTKYEITATVRPKVQIRKAANISEPAKRTSVLSLLPEEVFLHSFRKDIRQWCGDKITSFSRKMFMFRNITVIPHLAELDGGAKNKIPKEQSEFYRFKNGFFSIHCDKPIESLTFTKGDLLKWEHALHTYSLDTQIPSSTVPNHRITDMCVVITRQEYANLYWTLIDLYDIYLTSVFANALTHKVHILMLDAHPSGHLESFWNMFASVQRPNEMNGSFVYDKLLWLFPRSESPILEKSRKLLPHIAEFRGFVLRSFSLPVDHKRNCDKLNILFILRRNYVAHPRNPSGKISRKIKNEQELLQALGNKFPQFNITGTQLDLLSVKQQVSLISKTDIYIGMHGAGLSYSMFLPKSSAVIELFPAYYKQFNWHMENIARRSGHFYFQWRNTDFSLENVNDMYTEVPPGIIVDLIRKSIKDIC